MAARTEPLLQITQIAQGTPQMVVILALIALHKLVLLEPIVAALAYTQTLDRFSSEIVAALVLALVLLDEIVGSNRKLTSANMLVVLPEPADLPFQTFLEAGLLLYAVLDPRSLPLLYARFFPAH